MAIGTSVWFPPGDRTVLAQEADTAVKSGASFVITKKVSYIPLRRGRCRYLE